MATIKDVALRAGVSVTTVSHVVNDTRHVSAKGRERVEQAIRELGYVPNAMARSLKLTVIAEGVETADHIRILEELDCDMLQGYALARPMPAIQIPSFVRASSWPHGQTAARALQAQLGRALPSRAAK